MQSTAKAGRSKVLQGGVKEWQSKESPRTGMHGRGTERQSIVWQWHRDESKRDGIAWNCLAKDLSGLALRREAMELHRTATVSNGSALI